MNYKTGWCITAPPFDERLFKKWEVGSIEEAVEKYKTLSIGVFDSYFELSEEKDIEKKDLFNGSDLLIINANVKRQKIPKNVPVNAHLHSRIYTNNGFPLGEAVYVSEKGEDSEVLDIISYIFREEYLWRTKILSRTSFGARRNFDSRIFEEFKKLQNKYLLCRNL